MLNDKLLKIEKVGKVWRAVYAGPNGPVTLCSCNTKSATEANAEYLMQNMNSQMWRAMISKPNVNG